jgi:GNAT superfamily N-acetyltransferase
MQENIEIKFASIDDVPFILSCIKNLAEFENLSHQVVATTQSLEQELFGATPRAEVIICYLNGIQAGFALFFHNFSTFLGRSGIYLEDLYVMPEYRCHGIAKKALVFLANLCKERNCGRLEWSCLDWNKKAIDFYLSQGATPLDDWTMYRVTGDNLIKLAQTS